MSNTTMKSQGESILVGGESVEGSLEIRELNGGFQHLYKFPNGRGASVVCHEFSYGGHNGLKELAVLRLLGRDSFELDYSTPITGDVLGWLEESEAEDIVLQIARLPKPSEAAASEEEEEEPE